MLNHDLGLQDIDLTREISFQGDITFDPEAVSLTGSYGDQLSLYRARKSWKETLENCFLLDAGHDFEIRVSSRLANGEFMLSCRFLTACGRYAFWRLTSEQAPEAQYLIETGHLPNSNFRLNDLISAPDLRPAVEMGLENECDLGPDSGTANENEVVTRLKSLLGRILRLS